VSTAGNRYEVGPDRGTLLLRTSRAGLAARAGHDLEIEVTRWSGEITVADDPANSAVDVTARTDSLRVRTGTGGVKPLSERDKREIVHTAARLLDAGHSPEARFVSTTVTGDGGGGEIEGTLTLRGRERALRLTVTRLGDGRFRATGRVVQSEFGIEPYSAFLGALKLADPVDVHAEIDLSEPST
jgi:polyisoprenoid-binding protein YceI